MNKKIVISLISIISLASIIIIGHNSKNNIEIINQRINKVIDNKPTERSNFRGLVSNNIEEIEYDEKNGRLRKIEDQSYVNLEKKEVYLDYEHQIERFENELVQKTLDIALPNYFYEQAMKEPALYKRVMEVEPELLNNDPRHIMNYAFFQYIKPTELEMVSNDMTLNLANSFDFFYFEDGINLNKVTFNTCDRNNCKDTLTDIRIRFYCGKTECRGIVSHKNRDYFIMDEKGRVFIYNELDKEGNQIPFIHGDINEY